MSAHEALKQTYDSWGSDYDTFLPYADKFAMEAAHYGGIFAGHGVQSILDAGCGTGRHAVLLAGQGFAVAGADLSDGMLEQARRRAAAAGARIVFTQSAFQELSTRVGGTFGGVLCTGSGLAHLIADADLEQALREIRAVLRPGGILVTDNIHFAAAGDREFHVGPLESTGQGAGEKLWLRVLRPAGPVVHYSAISMFRRDGRWEMEHRVFPLSAEMPARLQRMLPALGFEVVAHDPECAYGGGGNEYLRKHAEPKSVIVARRT